MEIQIVNNWMWLCIAFGVMLLTVLIKSFQSRYFYTHDVVERKFSTMDLELPSSAQELVNIIKGIFLLPVDKSQKTLKALKGQLYVDFIFMPAAYGSVFLVCMIVAGKMSHLGNYVFSVLGWLQIVAWLCDIIENIYLLNKIDPGVVPSQPAIHKAWQVLEITKWGIVMTGTVCAVFGLIYFWLVGHYSYSSLCYLLIIIGEIVFFIIADKMLSKKSKSNT
ncbi:MAG: hypothetical protein ABIN93_04150 [Ginsengibacter sp.]